VKTIAQEKLSGAGDERLYDICIAVGRCLISLDLDFAGVVRFLPRVASLDLLTRLVRGLLEALQTASIAGRLWVVEAGRIRVYEEAAP
jgi:hypothetical protein